MRRCASFRHRAPQKPSAGRHVICGRHGVISHRRPKKKKVAARPPPLSALPQGARGGGSALRELSYCSGGRWSSATRAACGGKAGGGQLRRAEPARLQGTYSGRQRAARGVRVVVPRRVHRARGCTLSRRRHGRCGDQVDLALRRQCAAHTLPLVAGRFHRGRPPHSTPPITAEVSSCSAPAPRSRTKTDD